MISKYLRHYIDVIIIIILFSQTKLVKLSFLMYVVINKQFDNIILEAKLARKG